MNVYSLPAMMFAIITIASGAYADPCVWRPSDVMGGGGVGAVTTGTGLIAGTGTAMHAAGFYTLVHASSGATMLASTAGGASAAGTVGIMGGTAGVVGTVGGALMSPVVITGAVVMAIGTAGWEGVCYFKDERTTDYPTVLGMMREIAKSADPALFRLEERQDDGDGARITVKNPNGGNYDVYNVADLYIANGDLMHRDWFLNTNIGKVAFIK